MFQDLVAGLIGELVLHGISGVRDKVQGDSQQRELRRITTEALLIALQALPADEFAIVHPELKTLFQTPPTLQLLLDLALQAESPDKQRFEALGAGGLSKLTFNSLEKFIPILRLELVESAKKADNPLYNLLSISYAERIVVGVNSLSEDVKVIKEWVQTVPAPTTTSPKPTPTRIFLSYGRKDDYLNDVTPDEEHTYHHDPARSFTRQLYQALQDAGFDVWWDREKMPNRGLTFLEEIRQAVHDSDKLVYIAGEHANASDYVKAEWEYALSQCKPIIPVLRNVGHDRIPSQISMGNAPDMRNMDYFKEKVEELIRTLREQTAPLGELHGDKPITPAWYVERGKIEQELQTALRMDATKPIVVTSKEQAVTLQSMGGLGKTTLVSTLCNRCDVRTSFSDGIFWLTVGKTPSIVSLQQQIGVTFKDSRDEYPDEKRGKIRLTEVLRNKKVLIVLDDVWNHQHVEAFRVESPAIRLIATTRKTDIATKLGVKQHTLDILSEEEGIALIGKRLERASDALPAHPNEEKALIRLLGGHTLAITISAARIAEEGEGYIPHYLARLQERRANQKSLLGILNMDENDKNYNLELSLSESYDELKPHEQAYFRALGILAPESTFDLRAAQAVWNIPDADDAEDVLTNLKRRALVVASDNQRYVQHSLLRDYARAKLEQHGETAAAFNRYADYIITVAKQFDTLPLEQWTQLEPDFPHIDWVGDQLAQQSPPTERMGAFAYTVTSYVFYRPLAIQRAGVTTLRGLNWLEGGLAFYQADANLHRVGVLLHGIGSVYSQTGKVDEALTHFQQALPIRREVHDRSGEGATLHNIGSVYSQTGKVDEALTHFQQALPIRREVHDRSGEGATLHGIGSVYLNVGKVDEALTHFQQALPILREVHDRSGEGATLHGIGSVYLNVGKVDEALTHFQQALPILREVHDRKGEGATLHGIGRVYSKTGKVDEALTHFQHALTIRREVHDRKGEAATYYNIGMVYEKLGDLDRAVEYVEQATKVIPTHDPNLSTFRSTLKQLQARRVRKHSKGKKRHKR
jgi:tetratricopeptide (TPR) repeat protein